MSENAEIVRSILAAWGTGDVEQMVRSIAAEAELLPLRAQLEGTAYRGPGGMRQFWEDLNADWEDLRLPISELRERGDSVVAICRLTARGRASGVDIDVRIGTLWELRDGEVMRLESFSDPADALRGAGLDE